MLHIKRRQFLQFASSTLATLGLSQFNIIQKSHRYARVLAQETNRKLALLVGINNYPFGNTLAGCLTDVDLQKHLLVHRFGFNESDILTLTDNTPEKPTRQNILMAFEEHLIKQAKPGDVVVFHFSGHGSQVADPQCIYKDNQGNCINSTLIAAHLVKLNVVMDSLLDDLNRGTRGGGIGVEIDQNFRGVDAKQLAAMSITFESVAAPNSYTKL